MIEAENLGKIYQDGEIRVTALDDISLKIGKGEFISIMGPSGSGKSTLLHLLGLLDFPTKGSIKIRGKDVSKLDEKQGADFRLKEMGFVFQFYSLLPELNVLENVCLPQLMLEGKSNDYAAELLEIMDLAERKRHYPGQLSGGEQQRVAIARALVNRPSILLADEPTASLDSKNAMNVMAIFKRLNEELGQTIIMVTHEEALGRMAQRGVWLKDGIVVGERRF
ncbi:MAG: ABC transporter ATP-binding protein [Candidatus Aenigmarchaeota archaeon]|nr:ABC transporter ATP-binding protein [Candidatus Aenigmarchaeota archaeon]